MLDCIGFAAVDATEPLKPFSFTRRDPGPRDVEIDILFCGVCHSDLHKSRNEWKNTTYPLVPGHEIVGRVVRVGSAVTRFKAGDLAGVGVITDSCRECGPCREGLEQLCDKGMIETYDSDDVRHGGGKTRGGYSNRIVSDEAYTLRVPANLPLEGVAPLLCAGITTYSPLRHWRVSEGQKVGVVGLGGLGHMGLKLAAAMGAHVVLFTTSPDKTEDAKRLGAKEVVISKDRAQMAAHAMSFDFILDCVSAQHPIDDTSSCSNATAPSAWSALRNIRWRSRRSVSSSSVANSPARSSAASPRLRRCLISAASTASPPTSRSSPFRRSIPPTSAC